MQVGIVVDTHDDVSAAERATRIFERGDVDVIVHCGDYVAPPTPAFEGVEVHGVLGNNDGEIAGPHAAFDDLGTGSEFHGRFAERDVDGTSFAVLHGESLAEVETIAAAGTYAYVCYGHHEREASTVGGDPAEPRRTVPDGSGRAPESRSSTRKPTTCGSGRSRREGVGRRGRPG